MFFTFFLLLNYQPLSMIFSFYYGLYCVKEEMFLYMFLIEFVKIFFFYRRKSSNLDQTGNFPVSEQSRHAFGHGRSRNGCRSIPILHNSSAFVKTRSRHESADFLKTRFEQTSDGTLLWLSPSAKGFLFRRRVENDWGNVCERSSSYGFQSRKCWLIVLRSRRHQVKLEWDLPADPRTQRIVFRCRTSKADARSGLEKI